MRSGEAESSAAAGGRWRPRLRKGNANKAAMAEAAETRWADRVIRDDNEADALWILELGLRDVRDGPSVGAGA